MKTALFLLPVLPLGLAADGRIYLASLLGKLTVVKAGGDLPEVVHSADFGERIAGTPALGWSELWPPDFVIRALSVFAASALPLLP